MEASQAWVGLEGEQPEEVPVVRQEGSPQVWVALGAQVLMESPMDLAEGLKEAWVDQVILGVEGHLV